MVIIKKVNWIDKGIKEAELLITDGKYSLTCFSNPFRLSEVNEYSGNIHILEADYVYKIKPNNYESFRIGSSYEHILKGKFVDLKSKLFQVGKIKIDISDICIPGDICENDFLEIKATRLDLY